MPARRGCPAAVSVTASSRIRPGVAPGRPLEAVEPRRDVPHDVRPVDHGHDDEVEPRRAPAPEASRSYVRVGPVAAPLTRTADARALRRRRGDAPRRRAARAATFCDGATASSRSRQAADTGAASAARPCGRRCRARTAACGAGRASGLRLTLARHVRGSHKQAHEIGRPTPPSRPWRAARRPEAGHLVAGGAPGRRGRPPAAPTRPAAGAPAADHADERLVEQRAAPARAAASTARTASRRLGASPSAATAGTASLWQTARPSPASSARTANPAAAAVGRSDVGRAVVDRLQPDGLRGAQEGRRAADRRCRPWRSANGGSGRGRPNQRSVRARSGGAAAAAAARRGSRRRPAARHPPRAARAAAAAPPPAGRRPPGPVSEAVAGEARKRHDGAAKSNGRDAHVGRGGRGGGTSGGQRGPGFAARACPTTQRAPSRIRASARSVAMA